MPQAQSSIDHVVQSIEDDFYRQGGVSEQDVLRLVDKNGLDASAALAVEAKLLERGIIPSRAFTDIEKPESASTNSTSDVAGDRFYHRNIARTKVLSSNEVIDLARQIRLGEKARLELETRHHAPQLERLVYAGLEAKKKLTESNLRLVATIAREYQGLSDLDLIDLIQDGVIGLIRACEKFDHSLGYQFSTYAVWWIRQAVIRAIQNGGATIRLPSHVHQHLLEIRRVKSRLEMEYDREPTTREIGEQLRLAPEAVQSYLDMSRALASLDRPLHPGSDLTLTETLAGNIPNAQAQLLRKDEDRALVKALQELPQREKFIIELRFGLGDSVEHTLEEIGAELGLSRERVRQLEKRALDRLSRAAALTDHGSPRNSETRIVGERDEK